jgi:hypothetical protein
MSNLHLAPKAMRLPSENTSRYRAAKYSALVQSLIIDALGMLSYALPGMFEVTDVAIAPLLAIWIWALHRNSVAAAIGFAEELLPFTDVVPTATITWFYRFVLNETATRQALDQ